MDKQKASQFIKQAAAKLGFAGCGIARAGFLEKEAHELENWLTKNHQGEMHYMANHFDMRVDPQKLIPGARSVISVLVNYFVENQQPEDAPRISRYAYGRDYHKVIRKKLTQLLEVIRSEFGQVEGRCFTDSAPVLEKAWAERAGLGWKGKHTNIISKQKGSWFFLGEIICDLELAYDAPVTDHCGSCTRCIDACPTDAIVGPYQIDGSKCISYYTIELREKIPLSSPAWNDWAFGCDICQEVCPWNRFSLLHSEPDFQPKFPITDWSRKDWEEMTETTFTEVFSGTPLKRAGFAKIKDSLRWISPSDSKGESS